MQHVPNQRNLVTTLEFTGERFHPEVTGDIAIEHLHRYHYASQYTSGKSVVDIASGEGYGSALLALNALNVVGIDISREAVEHASEKYQSVNMRFLHGSCTKIPIDSHTVDVVVSFETIEHHDEHEQMIKECKRILKPDGILIISSPDKYNYSVRPNYSNPHHVKELFEQEFRDLLNTKFQHTAFLRQRVVYGSAIFKNERIGSTSFLRQNNGTIEESVELEDPLYWLAIATDSVEIFEMPSTIFEQSIELSDAQISSQNHILHLKQLLADEKVNAVAQVGYREALVLELQNTIQEISNNAALQLSDAKSGIMRLEAELSTHVEMLDTERAKAQQKLDAALKAGVARLEGELNEHVRIVNEQKKQILGLGDEISRLQRLIKGNIDLHKQELELAENKLNDYSGQITRARDVLRSRRELLKRLLGKAEKRATF